MYLHVDLNSLWQVEHNYSRGHQMALRQSWSGTQRDGYVVMDYNNSTSEHEPLLPSTSSHSQPFLSRTANTMGVKSSIGTTRVPFLHGKTLVAAITSVCSAGFLLFGYDQGCKLLCVTHLSILLTNYLARYVRRRDIQILARPDGSPINNYGIYYDSSLRCGRCIRRSRCSIHR